MKQKIYLVCLDNTPIFEQLQIEEALMRADARNWFILNTGSMPSIVMGISAKVNELVHLNEASQQQLPVIKRFSGGGTVVVDENTLFVSWIAERSMLPVPCFPEPIMEWSADFYRQALGHPLFSLKENDYLIGEKKCGGNAQYLRKERWLHHSTLLWDFDPKKMQALKMPSRTPYYRAGRNHGDFLCSLKNHFASKEEVIKRLITELHHRYDVQETGIQHVSEILQKSHRQATQILYQH